MRACGRVLGERKLHSAAWRTGVSDSEYHMRLQLSINRDSFEISLITTLIVVIVPWVTWLLVLQVTYASSSRYSKETYTDRRCRLGGELKRRIDPHDYSRGRGYTLLTEEKKWYKSDSRTTFSFSVKPDEAIKHGDVFDELFEAWN